MMNSREKQNLKALATQRAAEKAEREARIIAYIRAYPDKPASAVAAFFGCSAPHIKRIAIAHDLPLHVAASEGGWKKIRRTSSVNKHSVAWAELVNEKRLDYLSAIANRLRVAPRTISRWARVGKVRQYRYNGRSYFSSIEVENAIMDSSHAGCAKPRFHARHFRPEIAE